MYIHAYIYYLPLLISCNGLCSINFSLYYLCQNRIYFMKIIQHTSTFSKNVHIFTLALLNASYNFSSSISMSKHLFVTCIELYPKFPCHFCRFHFFINNVIFIVFPSIIQIVWNFKSLAFHVLLFPSFSLIHSYL